MSRIRHVPAYPDEVTLTDSTSTTLALGPDWISAETIAAAGLLIVLLVIFTETGLLIGFFLPGDSLLFTTGLLLNEGTLDAPLWLFLVTVPIAAIVGDQVGYTIGRVAGPKIFERPDSRFFQQEYVDKAYSYFEKYGPRTIVIARFVPIVRTFAPVVAGVSHMNRKVFTTWNVLGGIFWTVGLILLGYWLGEVDVVADNVEIVILGIVFLSVLPIIIEVVRARREFRAGPKPRTDPLPKDVVDGSDT